MKRSTLFGHAMSILAMLALAACQTGPGGIPGPVPDEGSITGYPTVNETPAVELAGGQIVLLDRLDEWEALREQFPLPDEEAPSEADTMAILPMSIDLRSNQTSIKNQGGRGTCVAFATVAAIEAAYQRERGLTIDLSEQYANHIQKMTALPAENQTIFERETQPGSSGGSGVGYQLGWLFRLRFGLPLESAMQGIVASQPSLSYIPWNNYEDSDQDGDDPRFDFDDRTVMQDEVDEWNLNHAPTAYRIPESVTLTNLPRNALESADYGVARVRALSPITLAGLKTELAAGRELAFGVVISRPNPCEVCEGDECTPLPETDVCYETRRDEIAAQFRDGMWHPLPTDWGGHAMVMVGYDDARRVFYVKNSWGRDAAGRGAPVEADTDADGFIEMSYDWVPRIYEAYSILETRDPAAWGNANQQGLLGDWHAEFDTFIGRAHLAAYHIPGAFPAAALDGETDRRIGTLYSGDAGAFRVNGSFTSSGSWRVMQAYFGSNAVNDSYQAISPSSAISGYVFTGDSDTMAGWVVGPTSDETPFYASLDDYPSMTPARATATTVAPADYLGRWALSDDGEEANLDLLVVSPGGLSVTGTISSGTVVTPGVTLTPAATDPCRFSLQIPGPGGPHVFDGGLFCRTNAPTKRALMAGTRTEGSLQRGFYAYRMGDVPLTIEIAAPTDGATFPRGSRRVDFEAVVTNADTIVWTSSLDGEIGTGTTVSRLDLSFGTHLITATASNADGDTDSDSIEITITNDPPVVEIFDPTSDGQSFCVGESIDFRSTVIDINNAPSYTLPDDGVDWRTSTDEALGTGKEISATFDTQGARTVIARATDDAGLTDEDTRNVNIVVCDDLAPSVTITNPSADTGTSNTDYFYDGYDDAKMLWYKDVMLAGTATDPEDGTLTGTSLVWTTDRTDLQSAALGTGASLTVRLYSDECFGVWHEISLTATDSFGNERTAVRRIFIWNLC